MRQFLTGLWAIALVLCLTACGAIGHTPAKSLVEQAIAVQLQQVQQDLSQQLRLADRPSTIQINRVAIAAQQPLQINDLEAFHIVGTCDYTLKLADRAIAQRQVPFEVYLQRQIEGKTWRIAYPQPGESGEILWDTQRIPTETYP